MTRPEEANGPHYDWAGMMEARARTRQAVADIAARIEVGMDEADADRVARSVLKAGGLLRGWHGIYVRFGSNTLRFYGEPSQAGIRLGADDIFIVDIGPVWRKWEGDAGDTFVTGRDPDMARARDDVRVLFDATAAHWREHRATGQALYAFAEARAAAMGWRLNLELGGHRLSDFPHALIHRGGLKDAGFYPVARAWVLEMHIRHPERRFGAFYEDLLLD
ncbi:M24 family metallopeptidase [Sphingomonas flavalba]|uniref:M24 family metallopeptidase n=1 Tax=Sphingomonas flavalba TaxID=2559804 RepID=UPI0039E00CC7